MNTYRTNMHLWTPVGPTHTPMNLCRGMATDQPNSTVKKTQYFTVGSWKYAQIHWKFVYNWEINVNKLVSLKHGVRAKNQTHKTAQITFVRTLDRTHWIPYKSRSRDPIFTAWTPHHLTIWWVREITSLDSKLPDQTEVQIRTDLRSVTLAERNRSHSSGSLFAQRRHCRCCWKYLTATYFDTSFLKTQAT